MAASMGVLVVMAEESGNDVSGNRADGLQAGNQVMALCRWLSW